MKQAKAREYKIYVGLQDPQGRKYTKQDVKRVLQAQHSALPYTLTTTEGWWEGQSEKSLVISFVVLDHFEHTEVTLDIIARALRKELHQTAVLLTGTDLQRLRYVIES